MKNVFWLQSEDVSVWAIIQKIGVLFKYPLKQYKVNEIQISYRDCLVGMVVFCQTPISEIYYETSGNSWPYFSHVDAGQR